MSFVDLGRDRERVKLTERLHPEHPNRPRTPKDLLTDLAAAKTRLRGIEQTQKLLQEQWKALESEERELLRLIDEPSKVLASNLRNFGQAIHHHGYIFVGHYDEIRRDTRLQILTPIYPITEGEDCAKLQRVVDLAYPPDEPAVPHAATADVCASDAQAVAAAESVATNSTSHAEPAGRLDPVELQSLDTEAA